MASPGGALVSSETDWLLGAIKTNWPEASFPSNLTRVNREESELLEEGIRSRKGELTKSNFVGAALATRTPTPVGTEYDHDLEAVVDVRIEGLDHAEWGHIDPAGQEGYVWKNLINNVREAILVDRTWPGVGRANTTYHSLTIESKTDRSSNYRDFYDYRFSVRFHGYETLP